MINGGDMDTNPDKEALDRFGELLVKQVRDPSVWEWREILHGRMKGVTAERLRPRLSLLNPNDRAFMEGLVPEIVDTVLHYVLWTLEQEESVDVSVKVPGGVVPSLREVSDGLAGELHDWIPRFSTERK
jgi:hypothetical protein